MAWRERTRTLLVVLAVIASIRVGQELYRWVAFAEERTQLRTLAVDLDSAGLEVVRTQIQADSLRRGIEEMDSSLRVVRDTVSAFEDRAVDGAIPERLYGKYRRHLGSYNQQVRQRNAWLARWREVVERNQAAVDRYNAAADSMRALATRMGEPYYKIPTPVEVAMRHGLAPPAKR